jgi:hypothetical protein
MVMTRSIGVVGLVFALGGCATSPVYPHRSIHIHWQRLVDETGNTCQRCATTQDEVRLAADTLTRVLRPLNMDVVREERPMPPDECARDILQSNRITVDGRSLADWLGGRDGKSLCQSCCLMLGPATECRTLTVDGQTYDAIPATLIVRAGLRAADAALAENACCARQTSRSR